MKRRIALLLVLCMLCCFGLCACDLKGDDKDDPAAINIDEVDPATPVLSIGKRDIKFAIYRALYESYLPYMQSSGYDPLSSKSSLESFQDWIADSLAKDLVALHQADVSGFTLNDEQRSELEAQTEDELNELYDTYYGYAEDDYKDDPSIPVEVYFANHIREVSEYYTGVAMTWDEYKAEYAAEAERSFIIERYKESVCSEFEPTVEDITNWYDTRYNSNKTSYTDNPGKYKGDEEYYEKFAGVKDDAYPVLYVPSGYSRMMHIVVSPTGELSEEYNKSIERMAEIKAEFADLAFEDAVSGGSANEAAIAKLIAEYNELKADTDAEFASYTAAARDKINQAYTALQAGQPFAEVMLEYTEDKDVVGEDGTGGCETFREKGQLISVEHTSTGDWSAAIKTEFALLKKGQYSNVFMDEEGSFHIVYYASDEPAGDVPLADHYSEIEKLCKDSADQVQWDALVEEWLNDPALVKNETLIRALGLADVKE